MRQIKCEVEAVDGVEGGCSNEKIRRHEPNSLETLIGDSAPSRISKEH
jgi:hypothetical protein